MKFEVTIRATVTKTYTVEADTKEEAEATAHDDFDTVCDGSDEDYNQETVCVEELT